MEVTILSNKSRLDKSTVEEKRSLFLSGVRKPENWPVREDYYRQTFMVRGLSNGVEFATQNVHTPFSLCEEMVRKLLENVGELKDKRILVYNIEFLDIFYRFGIMWENEVWFVNENPLKVQMAKDIYIGDENDKFIVQNWLNYNFNNMKFDVIVGNPPYNNPRNKCNGDSLWPDFVKKSLSLLKPEGYLCYVHPNGWRKPGHELWNVITDNQINFIKVLSEDGSKKTFGVGTRADWYILKKTSINQPTIINDELGNTNTIDLRNYNFLPNYMFEVIDKIIGRTEDKKCEIIYNYNYGVNIPKDWISVNKSDVFKYPLIHALSNNNMRCYYSSINTNGHFGVPKVILNDSRYVYPYNDYNGEYGMTQHCFAIIISSKKEGDLIVAAINTPKFKEIVKATKWSNFQTDYKMFKYFKKDFWKYFVDVEGKELK